MIYMFKLNNTPKSNGQAGSKSIFSFLFIFLNSFGIINLQEYWTLNCIFYVMEKKDFVLENWFTG